MRKVAYYRGCLASLSARACVDESSSFAEREARQPR